MAVTILTTEKVCGYVQILSPSMYIYTVKPVHVVTSIKQTPALKGNFILSFHKKFHMN